ncbi:MAG: hypothetical protein LBQ61_02735 [Spirochaetales bacterium]|nr:hypothetical protein [Spirochaetales bacterium]
MILSGVVYYYRGGNLKNWYKLDNAAKLFSNVASRKNSSVFRIAVVMQEEVDGSILQKAVDHIYARFPMFFTRMRSGVFWNYMDELGHSFKVVEESGYPCGMIDAKNNNGYMLKILYYYKRISFEAFHSLTDGSGAVEFVKTLVYYYLCFMGKAISPENKILLAEDGVSLDESEDSYSKYCEGLPGKTEKNKNSYKITGTSFSLHGNNITTGIMSAQALNGLAKAHGTTITPYLAAVLVQSIYQSRIKPGNNKSIVVAIPVNLRNLFPSKTMRNFSCVVNLDYNPAKGMDLADIIGDLTARLKEKTKKQCLQRNISNNVRYEQNIAVKFVPLFVKRVFIRFCFDMLGENKKTITLSNVGNITTPADMSPHIKYFEATLYPTQKRPLSCAVCSVDDKLSINFSRTIVEPDIIRRFFSFFANEAGLDVVLYSNDWGIKNE